MIKRILTGLLLALTLAWAAPSAADQGSLCMPTTGTVSGLTFSQNVNAALQALVTSNSGASAPVNPCGASPQIGQVWLDSSGSLPIVRYYDGTSWLPFGTIDNTTHTWVPPVGGGGNSVASASTTDLWSIPQAYVTITGSSTITSLGATAPLGQVKFVKFAAALTLTYNATSLILPGTATISTAAGDTMIAVGLGGGNVMVLGYTPATGAAILPSQRIPTGAVQDFLLSTPPAGWLKMNGTTVGDASSNASNRANADTQALFAALWNLDPTVSLIYTSAGVASTRGANAAADFAAHKQLLIPDTRGYFSRALDDGKGIDTGRVLGSGQFWATAVSAITATFTGQALPTQQVNVPATLPAYNGFNPIGGRKGWSETDNGGTPRTNVFTSDVFSGGTPVGTVTLSGAPETRPSNIAFLRCIKL